MNVGFPLLGTAIQVEEGTLVSEACRLAGAPLNLVCGGNGTCNKCRVDVMEDGHTRSVLGCQHVVSEGMEILVAAEEGSHQLLESVKEATYELAPAIRRVAIPRTELKTSMGSHDFTCLADALQRHASITPETPDYATMLLLEHEYRSGEGALLNVVLDGNRIVDLVGADEELAVYGAAVDIGTTSVVVFLFDLLTCKLLGRASALNGQCAFGADVISRIEHAGGSSENLKAEQAAIMKTVDELLGKLCEEHGVARQGIYEMVYCGNSTMQHLFLALDPKPLGRSPFTGVVAHEFAMPASSGSIAINPRGKHVYMPLIGGYVGADTLACMLELPAGGDGVRMMIDLGTNCEVSIGNDERTMVASTACGPALEGAGLSMGMRAKEGAIETACAEDGQIVIGVIGDAAPVGLCGSGIIDVVAMLLAEGIVNKKGAFLKGRKLEAHPWHDKVREDEERGRYFVLVEASENPNGQEIYITQKDIRAIQLAKAAIYTGCEILVRNYGTPREDIEEICLAGAFGNYIDIEHAQSIGLIPKYGEVPVRSMGNGAGLGVQRYLVSQPERARAEYVRMHATHVELADDPDFTDVYLSSMSFGA